MNSMEKDKNFEKPQIKYREILEEQQERGKKLDDRFASRIKYVREGCFKHVGVSSPEGLIERLSSGQDIFSKVFHHNIGLEGYGGEVGALDGGKERYAYLSTREEDKSKSKSRFEGEGKTEDALSMVKSILLPGERLMVFVWKSKGLERKGKLHEYEHNGVIVDKEVRGRDLGFGLYRIHEAVFGEMKKEITPKLSLLKLYLKLGFVPKKIINQEDGKELPMDVESAIERYFLSGNEDLPFLVYLEKE